MKCRHCKSNVRAPFLDLGTAPPSNSFLSEDQLIKPEYWLPLRILVCENCWLAQTQDVADRSMLFDSTYAYFSSYSSSWLAHCEKYAASITEMLALDDTSLVVEIAANDGCLLECFKNRGIPCFGVEPTSSTAAVATKKGIKIIEKFFGYRLAKQLVCSGSSADLIIANNVLAHVPDINDFVAGITHLLSPQGTATFEFPHLLRLVEGRQFDTVYHEHFSYLSITSVNSIFNKHGLSIFDVEEIPTHGGSLRVYAQKVKTGIHATRKSVNHALNIEKLRGVCSKSFYADFQRSAEESRDELVSFLIAAKRNGRATVGYGAAAKGSTLLNFAGIRRDLVSYVVDKNPAKQGKFMPGSRIPIIGEEVLRQMKPSYILVLPWNILEEVVHQLNYVRDWGAKFVTAVPRLTMS